jgi:hypothetical protein
VPVVRQKLHLASCADFRGRLSELTAEILRQYERDGDAMRYVNAMGQIAWKASPAMLQKLADAEREVQDDMEDLP